MCSHYAHFALKIVISYTKISEAAAELGEKLNHFLTRLEDIGVDGLPGDLEIDLRHVMNLESPSIQSRLMDLEHEDLKDFYDYFLCIGKWKF